jgi:DNA-binding MarR family transcriptional regulator
MAISHEAATELGMSLVRVMKLFTSIRQHAPRLHPGVEATAYPIMFNLVDGPRRVTVLADCVHSDVSTVSRQVSALVAHGLMEKLPDPGDGRATMLSLTAQGTALVERLKAQRSEWFRTMLHDWDADEVSAFIASLDRFADACEGSRDALVKGFAEAMSAVGDSAVTIPHDTEKSLTPSKEQ